MKITVTFKAEEKLLLDDMDTKCIMFAIRMFVLRTYPNADVEVHLTVENTVKIEGLSEELTSEYWILEENLKTMIGKAIEFYELFLDIYHNTFDNALDSLNLSMIINNSASRNMKILRRNGKLRFSDGRLMVNDKERIWGDHYFGDLRKRFVAEYVLESIGEDKDKRRLVIWEQPIRWAFHQTIMRMLSQSYLNGEIDLTCLLKIAEEANKEWNEK